MKKDRDYVVFAYIIIAFAITLLISMHTPVAENPIKVLR